MTGDDHASSGGTAGEFEWAKSVSPAAWNVVGGSAPSDLVHLSDHRHLGCGGRGYEAEGFEIIDPRQHRLLGLDAGSLADFYDAQLGDFATNFPSVSPPATHRTTASPGATGRPN